VKSINPEPRENVDGGVDYIIPCCPEICYRMDKEGAYLSQCPQLVIKVREGLLCNKYKGKFNGI